jgi:hypothetical protein
VDAHTLTRQAEILNKPCLSARKLTATVYWDRKGMLMLEFMQKETTITSEVYFETLKWLGMLTPGVILLHINAHPHTAAHTQALL